MLFLSLSLSLHIYIYIHKFRERKWGEREGFECVHKKKRGKLSIYNSVIILGQGSWMAWGFKEGNLPALHELLTPKLQKEKEGLGF